jgi:hypothetical protein
VNLWQAHYNLEKWEPLLALHLFSGQAPFASTRQMMMEKRPRFMKDIYNCAECVLAWLGASDEHGEFAPKKLEAAGHHIRRRRAEQNYTMSENNDSWVWVWVYGKNLFMSFTYGDSVCHFASWAIPSIGVFGRELRLSKRYPSHVVC